MSEENTCILGRFQSEEEALSAVLEIQEKGWEVREVYSPIPAEKITAVLNRKKSKVGWFTLAGGIIGFCTGWWLAAFTATRWSMIVGGKPILSWFPFFIVAFELTILFAVFGNILGLITQVGLPIKPDEHYHPACSGSEYGLLAGASSEDMDSLRTLLQNKGGIVT